MAAVIKEIKQHISNTPEYYFAAQHHSAFETAASVKDFFDHPDAWFKAHRRAFESTYRILKKISQGTSLTAAEQKQLERYRILRERAPSLAPPPQAEALKPAPAALQPKEDSEVSEEAITRNFLTLQWQAHTVDSLLSQLFPKDYTFSLSTFLAGMTEPIKGQLLSDGLRVEWTYDVDKSTLIFTELSGDPEACRQFLASINALIRHPKLERLYGKLIPPTHALSLPLEIVMNQTGRYVLRGQFSASETRRTSFKAAITVPGHTYHLTIYGEAADSIQWEYSPSEAKFSFLKGLKMTRRCRPMSWVTSLMIRALRLAGLITEEHLEGFQRNPIFTAWFRRSAGMDVSAEQVSLAVTRKNLMNLAFVMKFSPSKGQPVEPSIECPSDGWPSLDPILSVFANLDWSKASA